MKIEKVMITYSECAYKDVSQNQRRYISHSIEELGTTSRFAYNFNGMIETVALMTSEGLRDITKDFKPGKLHIGGLLIDVRDLYCKPIYEIVIEWYNGKTLEPVKITKSGFERLTLKEAQTCLSKMGSASYGGLKRFNKIEVMR